MGMEVHDILSERQRNSSPWKKPWRRQGKRRQQQKKTAEDKDRNHNGGKAKMREKTRNSNWSAKDFDGWFYAHRGYHGGKDSEAPENSLAAFERAVENGFGAELDVHLLKDGNLAVLHDSSLKRMCGKKGIIEDLTLQDLGSCKLGKSNQTIPTFQQVLEVFSGRTPLIVELKPVGDNAAELTEKVCQVLESYDGVFCIESFDPKVLRWLKKNRPQILRGQLAMDYMKNRNGLSFIEAVIGTWLMTSFLTKPDFIAYRFTERRNLGNRFQLKVMKRRGAAWTLRTPEDLKKALDEGLWPIFENFDPKSV